MMLPWHADLFALALRDRAHLPHAILLHGAPGVGKLDLAIEMAMAMLCEQPREDGHACRVCDACNWFEQGNHPDFRRLEPIEAEGDAVALADESAPDKLSDKTTKRSSQHIKVEAIRELSQFLGLTSHRGGWRVALIQPVEAMNTAAANALLKTLEEPPARVLLLLLTHQLGRVMPTVLSRCRKLHVPLPPAPVALSWLQDQGVSGAQDLLSEAGGAPLAALRAADSTRSEARDAFLDFLTGQSAQRDVCDLAQTYKTSHVEAWGWLMRWVHDLISQRLAGRSYYFTARAGHAAKLSGGMDLHAMLAFQRELQGVGRSLRHPLNMQLLLESLLIRYQNIIGGRA